MTRLRSFSILFGVLFALTAVPALADEVDALFIEGNEFYQTGNYPAAIESYEKIIELGYESWEVYYNLGNAYYKNGDLAHALLNFERAKRLNPKNEDVIFNLELANLSVVDRIPEMPQVFFVQWFSNLADLFSLKMLGLTTVALYVLLMALLTYRILKRGNISSRLNILSIIVSGVLLLFSATLFLKKVYDQENRVEAIVSAIRIDVKSAPLDSSTDVFTLHEGVKVQVQELSGDWARIRLSDGKVGWVKAEVLVEI